MYNYKWPQVSPGAVTILYLTGPIRIIVAARKNVDYGNGLLGLYGGFCEVQRLLDKPPGAAVDIREEAYRELVEESKIEIGLEHYLSRIEHFGSMMIRGPEDVEQSPLVYSPAYYLLKITEIEFSTIMPSHESGPPIILTSEKAEKAISEGLFAWKQDSIMIGLLLKILKDRSKEDSFRGFLKNE